MVASPRISVVVPAYNATRFLERTVKAVQAQTVDDWELVIVDDGSKDDTFALAERIAASDARIRAFTKPNGGVSTARNFGFDRVSASSKYVGFIDADDLYEPDALEVLAGELEANPGLVAAHGLARFVDEDDNSILLGQAEAWGRNRRGISGLRSVPLSSDEPTTLAVLAHWNTIHTPGQIVIRRSVLDEVGGNDVTLAIAQDYDQWIRLALRGDFAFVDRVVMGYRVHGAGISRDSGRRHREDWRVRRRLLSLPNLTSEQRRLCVLALLQAPAVMRLAWARDAVARGEPREALAQARPLVSAYARLAVALPDMLKR